MLVKILLPVWTRTFCQRFALAFAMIVTLSVHAADTPLPAQAPTEVVAPAATPTTTVATTPVTLATTSVTTPTTTPTTTPVITTHPLNMVWGILFLLALIGAAWWLIRRSGGLQFHAGRGMKVVTALQVGPHERVVLIEMAGQQWLLGVASGNINLLQHFEQPVLQTGLHNGGADDFASKIRAVLQQGINR